MSCVIFGDDQATGGNAITGNAEKSLPTKEEKDEVNRSSSSATRTGSNGQRTKRKKVVTLMQPSKDSLQLPTD
ncbi:hypothetical protein Syun_021249 [Stephania yunnanensis]|uniref:Uncharacterized protein n=1 Tax=Stephania yunnanensis TaxID=152371 RepID=A0AAP0IHA0_9MAGN